MSSGEVGFHNCSSFVCFLLPSFALLYRRLKPATHATRPVPKIISNAGSGVGVGVGEGPDGGVGVGVGVGSVCLQSSQSGMNAIGTAARNNKGHFGKPPPPTRISPQSQIVPSTSPSSEMSSTPRSTRCETIGKPESSASSFGSLEPMPDTPPGPVVGAIVFAPEETGSCVIRVK